MTGLALAAASPVLAAGPETCRALIGQAPSGGRITEAVWMEEGAQRADIEGAAALPAHCLVRGVLAERRGVPAPLNRPDPSGAAAFSDRYAIRFELRLPQAWQERFFYEGGGGANGVVKLAIGHVPGLQSTQGYAPALARGFAVVTSDSGHDETQNVGFGVDPQARLNYAYASLAPVNEAARGLVLAFYGSAARHAYFLGCSKGGQEALQAMQRLGDQFDGIVAGAPGFHLARAAVAEAWDSQALAAISPIGADGRPDLARAFSAEDLNLVAEAVVRSCGDADRRITDPAACRFDPAVLQCRTGDSSACLTAPQIGALRTIFGGARSAAGAEIYPGWFYDSGIGSPGWRQWKLGAPGRPALNLALGGSSLRQVFVTPPDQPGFDILTTPIDSILAGIHATAGAYTTPSDVFMTADRTDIADFAGHHGRLILFHGVSDPVFSAQDTLRYHEALTKAQGPDMARLFLVPGMTHCAGGDYALDSFDTLDAITAWVEQGKAPDRLIATAGKGAGGKLAPGLSRPICAYPGACR